MAYKDKDKERQNKRERYAKRKLLGLLPSPERKRKQLESMKKKRDSDPEKHRECQRKRYRDNVEAVAIYRAKRRAEHPEAFREYQRRHQQTAAGKYGIYKSGAERRSLVFDLSMADFMSFWQKPCFYCGVAIETIGLDRIDNSRGYEIDNVVPCCPICNYGKLNRTFDEFIEYCQRMANHWNPLEKEK